MLLWVRVSELSSYSVSDGSLAVRWCATHAAVLFDCGSFQLAKRYAGVWDETTDLLWSTMICGLYSQHWYLMGSVSMHGIVLRLEIESGRLKPLFPAGCPS
jgi:hypothetical protein